MRIHSRAVISSLAASLWLAGIALANGGPFVVKYPSGDPAAKGTLAKLDPDLKPARESRLKVLDEDLKITFQESVNWGGKRESEMPLVSVTAAYRIENPTDDDIEVVFGFPILRGVYLATGMTLYPDVQVTLDGGWVAQEMISNSMIYGIIRQRARETIDKAIASSPELAKLVKTVKDAETASERETARAALDKHLTAKAKWDRRNAALMVEYASNRFQVPEDVIVVSGGFGYTPPIVSWPNEYSPTQLQHANLGPLRAIGEQKATQFFAQLASAFDKKAGATYEAIFAAWGGDVREMSVELDTGKVRPREFTASAEAEPEPAAAPATVSFSVAMFGGNVPREYPPDPTIYARVDYLDPNAKISEDEKASCRNVLKNLDVIFTFAPMNLIKYTATFPAKSAKTLSVAYKQYPYADSRSPESYQHAYILHPASLWDSFGPINLEIAVPEGINCRASVPVEEAGVEERPIPNVRDKDGKEIIRAYSLFKTTVDSKKGELLVAIDSQAWKAKFPLEPTAIDAPVALEAAGAVAVPGGSIIVEE